MFSCSPLPLAIVMSYLSLALIDVNNTKDDLFTSILHGIGVSLTNLLMRGIMESPSYHPSFSAVIEMKIRTIITTIRIRIAVKTMRIQFRKDKVLMIWIIIH